MHSTFVSAVVLLLLVADPLGNIPIFVAALRGVPPARKPALILRECLIAFAILLAFMLMGNTFLDVLGLTGVSLQIGGGVILFLIALRMVFPVPEGIFGTSPGGEPFIVPLAIPALAGPSALGTVLLLVSRDPARLLEWIAALPVKPSRRAAAASCARPASCGGPAFADGPHSKPTLGGQGTARPTNQRSPASGANTENNCGGKSPSQAITASCRRKRTGKSALSKEFLRP